MVSSAPSSVPDPVYLLIDQIGDFIEYWGFRKVDGMIWAMIFLSAKPLSGQDLADRLQLSKGMVSISINTLLSFGVIHASGKGSGRTTYYESSDDLDEVIRGVLRSREAELLRKTQESVRQLQTLRTSAKLKHEFSPQRIQTLSKMIGRGSKLLNLILRLKLLKV